MRTIYLARPIDYTDPVRREQLELATKEIRKAVHDSPDAVLFDPASAFEVGFTKAGDSAFILDVNAKAIAASDTMIVLWPAGSTSWGVPAEVQAAQALGNEVHIVTTAVRSWAMPKESEVHYHRGETLGDAVSSMLRELGLMAHPPLPVVRTGDPDWEKRVFGKEPRDPALRFARLREDEFYQEPTRGYATDAGIDLYVSADVVVQAHDFVDVPSNTAVDLPEGTWGYLTGRSSTLRKKGLLVNPGVIDYGYTGELFSGVQNMRSDWVELKAGERIAQLIVLPMVTHQHRIVTVPKLRDKDRGSNGFGSSGV